MLHAAFVTPRPTFISLRPTPSLGCADCSDCVDCSDVHLDATGTRSLGGDAGSKQWGNIDDSQLLVYMLVVVYVVDTVIRKIGFVWRRNTNTPWEWVRLVCCWMSGVLVCYFGGSGF